MISEQTKEMYSAIRLPKNHWDCRLSNLPEKAYSEVIEEYFNNIVSNIDEGNGFYLYGPYARGKSGLGAILLKGALAHGIFGLWVNFQELHNFAINPENHMFSEEETYLDRISSVPILVVDEFVLKKNKAWSIEVLEKIVRERTQNLKSTIITSNSAPRSLVDHEYTQGLASVMREKFQLLLIEGKNFRE